MSGFLLTASGIDVHNPATKIKSITVPCGELGFYFYSGVLFAIEENTGTLILRLSADDGDAGESMTNYLTTDVNILQSASSAEDLVKIFEERAKHANAGI